MTAVQWFRLLLGAELELPEVGRPPAMWFLAMLEHSALTFSRDFRNHSSDGHALKGSCKFVMLPACGLPPSIGPMHVGDRKNRSKRCQLVLL